MNWKDLFMFLLAFLIGGMIGDWIVGWLGLTAEQGIVGWLGARLIPAVVIYWLWKRVFKGK